MSDFKKQPKEYAQKHYQNAAGSVPDVEKTGNIEVFKFPDKPDGRKGMRGFTVRVNLGEVPE